MATINSITETLNKIIKFKVNHSIFIWGPPGIGKSSVVKQVANNNDMELIDLRVSQLAPTDLRGVPFIKDDEISRFAPPSFLPREGSGILFLDELNMATPAMMGVAQQLILDRKVGDYEVPENWFIVAAGNRSKDRAAVSQMPSPVGNRFIHFDVEPDLDSWKKHAIKEEVDERIISFLNFRPELLFKLDKNNPAWPSPRSWGFASDLLNIGLDSVSSAVGDGVSAEFNGFTTVFNSLPDIEGIFKGNKGIKVPHEPSLLYASCGALVSRAKSANDLFMGFKWLINGDVTEDYAFCYMSDVLVALQAKNILNEFVKIARTDKQYQKFLPKIQEMMS